MVAHCDFDLHFLDGYLHWASFHMCIGHLYMIFEEMSVQVLSPFFKNIMFLLFCFYWDVEFFVCSEYNPRSDIWFVNIFYHSRTFFFTLMIVLFVHRSFQFWCSSANLFFSFVAFEPHLTFILADSCQCMAKTTTIS